VPQEWTNDQSRCERAGMPAERPFATKPQLAQQRLKRAFDAGVPAAWVTGDSVYGDNWQLRLWLEEQEYAHVLAVSGKELSLSRLNHRLPGCETHPKVVQGTAQFHHQIANALLPQADPVFDDATTLDTAVDMLDP
jgi:hypothetical protein